MRTIIGLLPLFYRRYNSHCYHGRAATIPYQEEKQWQRLTTERLMKCPVNELYNPSKNED